MVNIDTIGYTIGYTTKLKNNKSILLGTVIYNDVFDKNFSHYEPPTHEFLTHHTQFTFS